LGLGFAGFWDAAEARVVGEKEFGGVEGFGFEGGTVGGD